MGFPFAFKKSLRSPKRRRRPERSGGQKILKIDLLEALRTTLNFVNFLPISGHHIGSKHKFWPNFAKSENKYFLKFFWIENFWFRPVFAAAKA